MYDLLNLEQQTYNVPSVRDLWIPNATLWDEAKITTLFGEHATSIILQVPIIARQEDNILCWKAIPSGICKTKSAYRQLRIQQRTNFVHIANQVIQILRQVWSDKLIQPRVETFAWQLLRLALCTASRIHRIILNVSDMCVSCNLLET
jgi:hypothetical protein